MLKWSHGGLAALSLLLAAAGGARASILTPTGDTHIQQGNASTNFNDATALASKNDTGTGSSTTDRIAFLRFDRTGTESPVTSATLVLTVTGAGTTQTGGNPLTFSVLGIPESLTYGSPAVSLENFVEGNGGTDNNPTNELRFNNTPGTSGSVNSSFVRTSYTTIGQFTSTASTGTVQLSNANLVNFLNADTNGIVGLVVVRDTDDANATSFANRDAGFNAAPKLFINQPVPEPGTFALAAAGAGMVLLRRARRR